MVNSIFELSLHINLELIELPVRSNVNMALLFCRRSFGLLLRSSKPSPVLTRCMSEDMARSADPKDDKKSGLVKSKETGAHLEGSWTVDIGDQDEAVHLWKYPGGYPILNKATEIYRTDKEFIDFRLNRNKMLRSRKNQILLAFSFWGEIKPRSDKNIYELRSYTLKPGTMIEWGNNWARGIKYRQEKNEAVAGFFNQIGELYTAYHLWGE
ncbi:hypothetical protein LSH36_12g04001 [Paralvinella palmiformis]|uniref:NIPSNAP domain-containing protein n=1 Tax=Paralvinella palmiformis TaxID=53620 RepID=A0AAD9NG57_9ANNE|nr:hypothetical protein LSH36_12g04001 [Paralvinella palmiformis]